MDSGKTWRDQLNDHAAELHELHTAIRAGHAEQAEAAAQALGPAKMTTGVDPQRPDDHKGT